VCNTSIIRFNSIPFTSSPFGNLSIGGKEFCLHLINKTRLYTEAEAYIPQTIHTARWAVYLEMHTWDHAYKLNKHSLRLSCLSPQSAELLLAGPISSILKRTRSWGEKWAYFLIPPPPIGPPLAAIRQLSIPPYHITIFIPYETDGSSYLWRREEDIPVFFKASSSAFSFFLSSQLNSEVER